MRRLVHMHKRKLLIALATAGFLSAGFGASVLPASAEASVRATRRSYIRSGASTATTSRQRAITVCAAAQRPRRKAWASLSSTRWWW